ncbi:MAG: YcxB family protein [Porcipelethomonas sp.]
MVIKAENNVDAKDIKALINCNSSKLKFMLILLTLTFAAFLAFCIIMNNTGKNTGYCIVGILWCIVVYAYVFIINPKIVYRSFRRKYTSGALIKYELTAKSAAMTVVSEKGKWEKRKNYRDMFRAYETPDYFFFYTKRNETFILKKSGIKQGGTEDISGLLAEEMGAKFIRKAR